MATLLTTPATTGRAGKVPGNIPAPLVKLPGECLPHKPSEGRESARRFGSGQTKRPGRAKRLRSRAFATAAARPVELDDEVGSGGKRELYFSKLSSPLAARRNNGNSPPPTGTQVQGKLVNSNQLADHL